MPWQRAQYTEPNPDALCPFRNRRRGGDSAVVEEILTEPARVEPKAFRQDGTGESALQREIATEHNAKGRSQSGQPFVTFQKRVPTSGYQLKFWMLLRTATV